MAKIKPKYFSINMNRKLDKNIPIFNLPAMATCPGKSPLCAGTDSDKALCYAAKAERLYPSASAKRWRTFNASKDPSFFSEVKKELAAIVTDFGATKVRIHESGDFYDQEYLDGWVDLMKAFPQVTFLAYTKSTMLNFSKVPSNLRLYQSYDKTNVDQPEIPGTPKTYILTKSEMQPGVTLILEVPGAGPAGFKRCPTKKEVNGALNYCGNQCSICWNGKEDVFFRQH